MRRSSPQPWSNSPARAASPTPVPVTVYRPLDIRVSDSRAGSIRVLPRPVADVYREFMGALDAPGPEVAVAITPVQVDDPIPIDLDRASATFDVAAEFKEMDASVATVHGKLGQLLAFQET